MPYDDLRAIERAIDSETAAILVEPIQGEGGVYVPDDGYLPGLRELCDQAGIAPHLRRGPDRLGRTGTLWAYEHAGIAPDIMTLAKALGGGVPIGAMLATDESRRACSRRARTARRSAATRSPARRRSPCSDARSRSGSPSAPRHRRRLLPSACGALATQHPDVVKEVRGRGLLVGDGRSAVPVGDVVTACRERGLLVADRG